MTVYSTSVQENLLDLSKTIAFLETDIQEQAKQIVTAYVKLRTDRRQDAQDQEDRKALSENRKPKLVWFALNPYMRYRNDSLDIGWQLIHRQGGRTRYTYIKREKDGGYNMRFIKKKAKETEWPLVEECERRQKALRVHWSQVIAMRAAVRRITATVDEPC